MCYQHAILKTPSLHSITSAFAQAQSRYVGIKCNPHTSNALMRFLRNSKLLKNTALIMHDRNTETNSPVVNMVSQMIIKTVGTHMNIPR